MSESEAAAVASAAEAAEEEEEEQVLEGDEEEEEVEVLFRARTIFPFEGTNDVELNLKKGDIINVVRTDVGGGWWEGEKEGLFGLFPEKYVSKVDEADEARRQEMIKARAAAAGPASSAPAAAAARSDTMTSVTSASGSDAGIPPPPGRHVILSGPRWSSVSEPIAVTLKTGSKGTKYSGMKQFTTYEIVTAGTGTCVVRRFKHFSWLHGRLVGLFPCINIPPIPDKQIQGRFDEEFIELRRRGLQRFLNRVAHHPVLGASSVFLHFVSASDKEGWKSGKRLAEQQAVSSTFLQSVSVEDSVTPMNVDAIVLRFSRFISWLDKHIGAWSTSCENLAGHQQSARAEYKRMGEVLKTFRATSDRPDYTTWWQDGDSKQMEMLMDALSGLGDGLDSISDMLQRHQGRHETTLSDALREYTRMLGTLPNIVKAHEAAWQDYQAQCKNGTPKDQLVAVEQRCKVVTNIALAEFRHFHEGVVSDFKSIMTSYIEEQAASLRTAADKWESLLPAFSSL